MWKKNKRYPACAVVNASHEWKFPLFPLPVHRRQPTENDMREETRKIKYTKLVKRKHDFCLSLETYRQRRGEASLSGAAPFLQCNSLARPRERWEKAYAVRGSHETSLQARPFCFRGNIQRVNPLVWLATVAVVSAGTGRRRHSCHSRHSSGAERCRGAGRSSWRRACGRHGSPVFPRVSWGRCSPAHSSWVLEWRRRSSCEWVLFVRADTCNGRNVSSTNLNPPAGLPRAAEGAQRRVLDGGIVIGRERQVYQTVKVFQNLGISLNAGLPVLVDTALQARLCLGNLVGVRLGVVVVVGLGGDAFEVGGVSSLSALSEQAEILQDVVLGMGTNPSTGDKVSDWRNCGIAPPYTYRISLYIVFIMRCSACLMATSRPLASQSHARVAGAWQMAQSGSILTVVLR